MRLGVAPTTLVTPTTQASSSKRLIWATCAACRRLSGWFLCPKLNPGFHLSAIDDGLNGLIERTAAY